MKLNLIVLWESAAADRDDRGWRPLPQGRHFIAERMAQRAITRVAQLLDFNRCEKVSSESGPLSLILSPNPGGRGQGEGVLASIKICDP
jgi:hypothetical protein